MHSTLVTAMTLLAAHGTAAATEPALDLTCKGATTMSKDMPASRHSDGANGNSATVVQSADAGPLRFEQRGTNNRLLAIRTGPCDSLVVDQSGDRGSAEIVQSGGYNSADVAQSGRGTVAVVMQNGSGNSVTINQSNGNK
jgi:hypothetical protein